MRDALWILTVVLALFGCGAEAPSSEESQKETPKEETGHRKLTHDTAPTYEPYRPATATGLTHLSIDVVNDGFGKEIKEGDAIDVHYTGKLENGTVFDSSDRSARAPTFVLKNPGGVIEGWLRGLTGLREGVTVKLAIPASMGYGAEGSKPKIPPHADLYFEIQVVKVH